jgi:hypothetical protein
MSNHHFTDKQIEQLQRNPYVKNVSEKAITYKDEFKELFISEYTGGKLPSQIFKDAGFDVQVAVESHESVVQLAGGPDECLVFGKGGVEAVDACRFVVSEDGFAVGIAVVTACGNDEAACEADDGVSFHEV